MSILHALGRGSLVLGRHEAGFSRSGPGGLRGCLESGGTIWKKFGIIFFFNKLIIKLIKIDREKNKRQ
jgi:hypothetical protein